MDWWVILLIVLGIVVVLAIAYAAVRPGRDRRLDSKREEARELRTTAEVQANRADQRATLAEEDGERAEADEQMRRADELDPDVDVQQDADAERADADRADTERER